MKLPSEDQIQGAFIQWCAWNAHRHPGLAMVFHVPNGAQAASMKGATKKDRAIVVARLHKLGMVDGIPDVFVPIVCGQFHGLFIEFKSANGTVSEAQKKAQRKLRALGYDVHNAFSFESAVAFVENKLASIAALELMNA